jgi:8-oxo-dGTP diphosphatase
MPFLLVRHAWAGHSKDWEGDDRLRPLDERGRRQAEALPAALARFGIERLISSPFLRCTQSFEPLAVALGLPIEERDELADDAKRKHALALLDELEDATAALCTHGELLHLLLGDPTEKGETTVVERTPDGVRVLERVPPPD